MSNGNSPIDYLTNKINPSTGLDETTSPIDFISKKFRSQKKPDYVSRGGFINDDLQSYKDYLGPLIDPRNNLDEMRAQAQSPGERWAHAAIRFVPGVVGKTVQSLGNVLGLPAVPFSDVNSMIDNPIVNLGRMIEESTEEGFPIYQKNIYTKGSFTDKLGTSEFWTVDFMDGLEFLTSAYLTSYGVGKATDVLLGPRLLKNITKVNKIKSKELADDLISERVIDAQKILYNTKFATTTALNTVGEAGIEARELRDQLVEQGVSMEVASKAAADAAIMNVSALLLSNAWQTRLFMGNPASKAARMKEMQKQFNKTKGLPANAKVTLDNLKKGSEGIKTSFLKEFGKQAPITMATEGGWEENVQTAIQLVTEENALHNPDYLNSNAIDMTADLAHQMVRNFGETEGQTAIFLGALLGLIGAGGSSIRDAKQINDVDQEVLKLVEVGNSLNKTNLGTFLETKQDEDGNTVFDLDENGEVKFDPSAVSRLTFKLLEDKSIFDNAMASELFEDKVGARILSQIALARDFYKHASSKEDIEFYNSKKDILKVADDGSFESQIEIFQNKYQSKLAKLSTLVRQSPKIEGVSDSVNAKIKDAIYMQGAFQFIIDELINEQNQEVSNTGTPLDEEFNNKISKRLDFLNKLKEDNKSLFSKLTDSKTIQDLDRKGAFEINNIKRLKKEVDSLEEDIGNEKDIKKKEEKKEKLNKLKKKFSYLYWLDSNKYGQINVKGKNSFFKAPAPAMPLDIVRDEVDRMGDTFSEVQRRMYNVGVSFANKMKITKALESLKNIEETTHIAKLEEIKKILADISNIINNDDYSLIGNPQEFIGQISALKNDIEQMKNDVKAFSNEIMNFNQELMSFQKEDKQVLTELTGVNENGERVNPEQDQKVFRILNKDGRELRNELATSENLMQTLMFLEREVRELNSTKEYDPVINRIDGQLESLTEKTTQKQEDIELNKKLVDGNIYAFDQEFTRIAAEEDINKISTRLKKYSDPNQLNRSEDVENDLDRAIGAVEYFNERSEMPSADKKQSKRLAKEYKDLIDKLNKVLKDVRDSERRNEQKLKRIEQDIREEKWNGLGRDHTGKVIDEEIDNWLRENLFQDTTTTTTTDPNIEAKKADIERRRQEELENLVVEDKSRGDTAFHTGERFQISVSQKAFEDKYDVDVSQRDANSNTGFRISNPLSKRFDTFEEALEYANNIAKKDKEHNNKINAKYDAELAELEEQSKTTTTTTQSNSYDGIIAKAEEDDWNPIYAEYIYRQINAQQKVTDFKKLLDKKLRNHTNIVLSELQELGNKVMETKWTAMNIQSRNIIEPYRTNPRSNLYSLLKASRFFEEIYPIDKNPSVANFLVSNDVSDFNIKGRDKELKNIVENHKIAVAYREAIDNVSSDANLVTRLESEKAIMSQIGKNEFAPTPNQVSSIRAFYNFFLSKNKKGIFGNTAVLGGVTGAGKTKMFATWARQILGIGKNNILALGHTTSSTRTINNEIPNINDSNSDITKFLPEDVANGVRIIKDNEVEHIAKQLPKDIQLFIVDEAFATPGWAIHGFAKITEKYNEIHGSEQSKLLILGDPSQLTIESLDSVTSVLDKPGVQELKERFNNIKFLPFLSINYRSNNFAISHAQQQYVGKVMLPESLEFYSSEKKFKSKTPQGVHSFDSIKDVESAFKLNIGNGRTKLVVVPKKSDVDRLTKELGDTMNNKIGEQFEIRVMTAIDAQGEQSEEVYILVDPNSVLNSVNYSEPISLIKEQGFGESYKQVNTPYNTLMYMLIGRAKDYTALPGVASDKRVTNTVDESTNSSHTQFKVNPEQNKKEYVDRLNKESEILSELYDEKLSKVKPENVEKEEPKEQKETEEEKEQKEKKEDTKNQYQEGESVTEDDIEEGDTLEQGVDITGSEQTLDEDEENDNSFDEDYLTDDEDRTDFHADSETEENQGELVDITGISIDDSSPQGPWELKIEHPTSANINRISVNFLDGESLDGQEVFFGQRVGDKGSKRIEVFYPISRDRKGNYNTFKKIGEISSETFNSEAGQWLNNNLEVQLSTGENNIKMSESKMIKATVSRSSTVNFQYSDKPLDNDPKVAIRKAIDKVKNTLFRSEQIKDDEVEVEFLILTKAIAEKHFAFKKKKLKTQYGAPYMVIHDRENHSFVVRMSMQKLDQNDEQVKILNNFIALTDQIQQKAEEKGLSQIKMGQKAFKDLIEALKTSYKLKSLGYSASGIPAYEMVTKKDWKNHINYKNLEYENIPKEFLDENLELVKKIFEITHRPTVRKKIVTREQYEEEWEPKGWKSQRTPTGKYTLYRVGPNNQVDYKYQTGITIANSPVQSALDQLVITNQFMKEPEQGEERKEANDFIKKVRHKVVKAKSKKRVKVEAYSIFGSEFSIYKALKDRFISIHKKDPSFYDIRGEEVNQENFEDYMKILKDYVSETSNKRASQSLNDLRRYMQESNKMSLNDLKNLLQFDNNGQSNFGDGTYLRKPLHRFTVKNWKIHSEGDFNKVIDWASKVMTTNLQSVTPTELFVKVDPSDTQSGRDVEPPGPKKDPDTPDTPSSFDDMLNQMSDDSFDRSFGTLQNNKTITVEQAKQIAKQLIPELNPSQLEFVQMHHLNSQKDFGKAKQLLGRMKGKVVQLGIVEGTEKDPMVFEEVLYHELMHLMWNFYTPYNTKQRVKKWLEENYPETKSMNHIELDEFISQKFQTYKPSEVEKKNLLQRLFDWFISAFNALINNEKSLYSLFDDIHQGKYSGKKDYSSKEFIEATKDYNNKIKTKLLQLEDEGIISKVCK